MDLKSDKGKMRWSLIPWECMEPVVEAFMDGAEKYEEWDWKHVKHKRDRYFSACMRHMTKWNKGERDTPDSGINHLGCAVACLLILIWEDLNR